MLYYIIVYNTIISYYIPRRGLRPAPGGPTAALLAPVGVRSPSAEPKGRAGAGRRLPDTPGGNDVGRVWRRGLPMKT